MPLAFFFRPFAMCTNPSFGLYHTTPPADYIKLLQKGPRLLTGQACWAFGVRGVYSPLALKP